MTKCAWATTLVGGEGYLKGIITIQYVLQHVVNSAYPLLVLHTSDIPSSIINLLTSIGCHVRLIQAIHLDMVYSQERFRDTWTKLVAWDQVDYDRLVLIDADMLPLRNMDILMTLKQPLDWIAACPACTCNPQQMKDYPDNWTPNYCAYTYTDGGAAAITTDDYQTRFQQSTQHLHYFNSGLVVLTPHRATFESMVHRLTTSSSASLSQYTFPDQDFLNAEFDQRWTVLPYLFNALKPMVFGHASMWDINKIYNLHYILTKPWQVDWKDTTKEHADYYPLYRLWTDAFDKALEHFGIKGELNSIILGK
ncbi:nucleotide-diphospho-sugar transferase [Chlamydoabsidia padenii]|nr:nucleotide-diphospho-sugar transferase [Chlamydoabsidia padenii]